MIEYYCCSDLRHVFVWRRFGTASCSTSALACDSCWASWSKSIAPSWRIFRYKTRFSGSTERISNLFWSSQQSFLDSLIFLFFVFFSTEVVVVVDVVAVVVFPRSLRLKRWSGVAYKQSCNYITVNCCIYFFLFSLYLFHVPLLALCFPFCFLVGLTICSDFAATLSSNSFLRRCAHFLREKNRSYGIENSRTGGEDSWASS